MLTIEPMISGGSSEHVQDADGWTLRTRDGSLAAHHEHTLVVTRNGPVLLTAAQPAFAKATARKRKGRARE